MADDSRIEKFAAVELAGLRTELLQSGMDSFQAAELLTTFLAGRGYGVDPTLARDAAMRLESMTCSLDCIQKELERVAFVM
ncbi:MAG TPA: hypothetical protein VKT75_09910 [Acidobacteriaceae bacterium]|nr:hypothetical protein [Acidobacteriaceae bacterium]